MKNKLRQLYDFDPWCVVVKPFDGESISHYLGRVERANEWTGYLVGKEAGIGAVLTRWKRFYFNPFPSNNELNSLAALIEIPALRLAEMLPPKDEAIKSTPTRLCAACFAEVPCHKIIWQYQSIWKCEKHSLKLLSKCPNCESKFKSPAVWEHGICSKCHAPFAELAALQKTA